MSQSRQRPVIFVPARLPSERLPRKLLKPLGGRPALRFLLDRLASVPDCPPIVICTTLDAEDDAVDELAAAAGVGCFRGSRTDIIGRFHAAARELGYDIIINVDGDDFFCAPELIARTRDVICADDVDFVRWLQMPLGSTPVAFSAEALAHVNEHKTTHNTETGWGRFFADSTRFRLRELTSEETKMRRPDLRMTVDYPEDYEFFVRVEEALRARSPGFTLSEIISLLDQSPSIAAINSGLNQLYWRRFEGAAVKPILLRPKPPQ